MELQHDHEFYLAKAEEYPLLDKLVSGETTPTGLLEEVMGKNSLTAEELGVCLEALCALGGEASPAIPDRFPYQRGLMSCVKEVGTYMTRTTGTAMVACGVVSVIFPIAPLVAAVIGLGMYGGGLAWGLSSVDKYKEKEKERLKQRRREALKPAYHLAASLDSDICRAFLYDDFVQKRPRFEQTYAGLPADERHVVDAQLYAFLGAGGMPSMDEQQLKGYLGGLLERAVESEAAEPEG